MLNNGQFKHDPTTPAAPLDVDWLPLPGEKGSGTKPLGTVLPPKTAEEASAEQAKRASRTFPSGTKLTYPKGEGTISRLKAGFGPVSGKRYRLTNDAEGKLTVSEAEGRQYRINPNRVAEQDAAKAKADAASAEMRERIANTPAGHRHVTPRKVLQNVLGNTSLKDAPSNFDETETPFARNQRLAQQAAIGAQRKDSAAKAAKAAEAETAANGDKTKTLAQHVADLKPGETKSGFSKKQLDAAARELAFTHWEKSAPTADFTAHDKIMAKHKAKVAEWNRGNPMPEDDTHLGAQSQRSAWRAKKSEWEKNNPEPENKRVEYRKTLTEMFNALPAGKNPRAYLKSAHGLSNLKQVKVHLEDHLRRKGAEIEAMTQEEPEKKPTYTTEDVDKMWRSKPEIDPQRTEGIKTFVKNPLTYHFGTGSGEGKK